jgi:hypothetical protein
MTNTAATLITSTVVTSTLLAASIALIANAQALEPNRDLNLPAQSLTDRASAPPTPAMVHALRKAKSRTFSARDGQVVLWQPGQSRDLVARFVNRGNERVEIRVLNEKNTIEDVYTLYPKSQSTISKPMRKQIERTYAKRVVAICPSTAVVNCIIDEEFTWAEPRGNDGPGVQDGLWLISEAWSGSINDAPDSTQDCLWIERELWSSNNPQSLDLSFVNTGSPSVEIFINYSNGTSRLINLSTGHFQDFELITTEDDVVSVTYHCDNDQGLACGNCTFDYNMAIN